MIAYFAYGSNMCLEPMRRRCSGARVIGPARLDGHRFAIVKPGYASVRRQPGSTVLGLMWLLTPRDLAALHVYENVAGGLYRIAWRPVRSAAGVRPALVYVARSDVPGRARIDYLSGLLDAAAGLHCPDAYMRELIRHTAQGDLSRRRRATGARR